MYPARCSKEEEDAKKIRDLDNYKRRLGSNREQWKLCDEMNRQRVNREIMRKQLDKLTVDDQN